MISLRTVCSKKLNTSRIEEQYASGTNNLKTSYAWPSQSSAKVYSPYPDYDSREYNERYEGAYVSCVGPRGRRLNSSLEDMVFGYVGLPKGIANMFASGMLLH